MPINLKRSQWRTVIVALAAMVAALGGLAICGHWPPAGAGYPAFCGVLIAAVGSQAWKATKEHQALEAKP